MLGEILNHNLNDLVARLKKVEDDIQWTKHQHQSVMSRLQIEKKRIELMIEIETLNNAEHRLDTTEDF